MSGPIGPVTGPVYQPSNLNVQTSASLNVSQDTLNSVRGLDSTFVTDPSQPVITIKNYAQAVSSSIREAKKQNDTDDLIFSTLYKDLRYAALFNANDIKKQIESVGTLNDTFESLQASILAVVDPLIAAANTYNSTNDLEKYQDMANAYNQLLNDFVDFGQLTQGSLDNYTNAVNAWNNSGHQAHNTAVNAAITNYMNQRNAINAQIDDYNAQVDAINQLSVSNDDTPAYQIPHMQSLPFEIAATPTPDASNPFTLFDTYDTITAFPYPGPPPFDVNPPARATWTAAANVPNSDQINQDIYKPLQNQLKLFNDANKRANVEIGHDQYTALTFGQVFKGAKVTKPVAKELQASGGSGSSGVASTLASDKADVTVGKALTQARTDAIQNVNGVPISAPILAQINGFVGNLTEVMAEKLIDNATNLAKGSLLGPTPRTSAGLGAAVALSFLAEATKVISEGDLAGAILKGLLKDPGLIGVSEADLKAFADQAAALANLELAKNALLLLAASLGTPGLISQVLQDAGAVDVKDLNSILHLQDIANSPIDQAIVSNALNDSISSLDDQRRATVINQTLSDLRNLESRNSNAQAQQALADSFRDNLIRNGVQQAEAQRAAAQSLQNLEYNNSGPSPQDRLNEDVRQSALINQTKESVVRSDLDRDEIDRISANLDQLRRDSNSYESLKQQTKNLLNSQGIDNSEALVNNAASKVESPLSNLFATQAGPTPELADQLNGRIASLLTAQGIDPQIADVEAQKAAALVYTDPTSIKSLVTENLNKYAEATEQTNKAAALKVFEDSIRPTLSTLAFLEKNVELPMLAIHSTIIFGTAGRGKVGPGPGVDVANYMV